MKRQDKLFKKIQFIIIEKYSFLPKRKVSLHWCSMLGLGSVVSTFKIYMREQGLVHHGKTHQRQVDTSRGAVKREVTGYLLVPT